VANVAGMEWNESPGVTPGLKGVEVIADEVKRLPNGPGVYRMINEDGDVLYVGKARSLKKRVTSYTRRGHSNRITRMIGRRRRWNSSPPAPRPKRCCWKPT
jgi:excinuclease ABC subunit C